MQLFVKMSIFENTVWNTFCLCWKGGRDRADKQGKEREHKAEWNPNAQPESKVF